MDAYKPVINKKRMHSQEGDNNIKYVSFNLKIFKKIQPGKSIREKRKEKLRFYFMYIF